MSREWKPGDVVAVADFGIGIVVRFGESGCRSGHQMYPLHVHLADGDWATTVDARPLVAIDPADREQVDRLLRCMDDVTGTGVTAMQAALREFANPTPPKPDEPTGLGAVVEDADGLLWVRADDGENFNKPWRRTDIGMVCHWQAVPAVRVLSEGVQP